jgi:hypothetical protein
MSPMLSIRRMRGGRSWRSPLITVPSVIVGVADDRRS